MSKWRLIWIATALIVVALASAHTPAGAQEPSLNEVLKRAATYVDEFRRQLSGITAEETYSQEVINTSRFVDALLVNPKRRLKSELLLVKPADSDRYVELRDVFEVDGKEYRIDPILEEGSDELFIIFRDGTSKDTTYPAGRYLYAKKPGPDGKIADRNAVDCDGDRERPAREVTRTADLGSPRGAHGDDAPLERARLFHGPTIPSVPRPPDGRRARIASRRSARAMV